MPGSLPPAPPGTFRLFRLLSLYPVPRIQIKTFSHPSIDPLALRADPLHRTGSPSHHESNVCPVFDAISYAWNPYSSPPASSRSSVRPHTHPSTLPLTFDPLRSSHGSLELLPEVLVLRQPITVVVSEYADPVTIYITTHLLHGLLTAQELCSPTWLFVDAICIDHTDPHDKAVQVQGMDRVFRGARRVMIWLGLDKGWNQTSTYEAAEADMTMGACLTYIPTITTALEAYLSGHAGKTDLKSTQHSSSLASGTGSLLAVLGLPPIGSPIWTALERLRLNPWFTRLWVIEELALSKEAVVLYGRCSLSWSMYARMTALCESIITNVFSQQHASELVNQLHFAYNSRLSVMTKVQALLSPQQIEMNTNIASNPTDIAPLMRMLVHVVRKSKASVHLDRVYAILGLLDDSVRQNIHVGYSDHSMNNYWLKWIELFQVMLHFAPGTLEELLSNACSLERHPNLPSWCPNLIDDSEKRAIPSFAAAAGIPKDTPWNAPSRNNKTAAQRKLNLQSHEIQVYSLQIDEISHVFDLSWLEPNLNWASIYDSNNSTNKSTDIDVDSDTARDLLALLWKCLEKIRKPNQHISDGDTVLARCLVANSNDNNIIPDPALLQQEYMAFMRYLEHYTWGPNSSAPMKKSIKSAALKFGNQFQWLAGRRALFVTKSGRAGLTSAQTQAGDTVCVIMDCRLPYVLRRVEGQDTFTLIGEAYVDDLMQGEALVGRDLAGVDQPEELTIC